MEVRTLWRLFATVCLIGLLGGCGQGPPGTTPKHGKGIAARIETLQAVWLPVVAVQPGTVVSADRVEVSSRLSGYLYDLDVHEGQAVKKDQLLFAVDPTAVKEQIREATAELGKAKAALDEARDNYERYKNLYRQQSATLANYQQAERNYKVAQGGFQAAQASLAASRTQLKYAEVRAPFDALVVSKLADNGQLSSPGMPVLVLENPNHLQAQVQVDEQAFTHLALGQQISIQVEGKDLSTRMVTGRVERLVAAADPATHTHLVKIHLPADSGASSGQFVLVKIPVGRHEGIVVPQQALHKRAGITGVFVIDADNRAQFRMVTPGEKLPQGRAILSGLFPGDRLIVSARGTLANGVKVQAGPDSHP
jgi:multidrug efflux system membrane fusion protein